MKHKIRINGEVKEMDFELGSGVLDKNGKEIFEGDKVKIKAPSGDMGKKAYPVVFSEGLFYGIIDDVRRAALGIYTPKELELVND